MSFSPESLPIACKHFLKVSKRKKTPLKLTLIFRCYPLLLILLCFSQWKFTQVLYRLIHHSFHDDHLLKLLLVKITCPHLNQSFSSIHIV
jgi:hypothetical protein